jgi:outer membrane protein assembly factor BamB
MGKVFCRNSGISKNGTGNTECQGLLPEKRSFAKIPGKLLYYLLTERVLFTLFRRKSGRNRIAFTPSFSLFMIWRSLTVPSGGTMRSKEMIMVIFRISHLLSSQAGKIFFITGVLCCMTGMSVPETDAAPERSEWPCFHGSARINKSGETGLLKKWPGSGPKLLRTISGLGEGYSTVSIAAGKLFTAGKLDTQTYVFAYDPNGKLLWKKPNGQAWSTTSPWASSYIGPRGTPTYDNGMVYHLGEIGRLAAFESETGKEIWSINLPEKFQANVPEYAYSESVLIVGDRLYCSPAGKKGFLVCLNKRDGSLLWANTGIPGAAAYSSPVPVQFGGALQIIGMSSNCVYGVEADTGKLLWKAEFEGKISLNCTDPIFHDGYVFVSTGYGKGCMLLKLRSSAGGIIPETVWQSTLMDNHHGGVILHDGYLYGAGQESRGWFCLEFMTGKEAWKTRGKGSLTFADGMLYILEETGDMKLVAATPQRYEERSVFTAPEGGEGMHWAHPVICEGRLYIRHTDKLFIYDIKG